MQKVRLFYCTFDIREFALVHVCPFPLFVLVCELLDRLGQLSAEVHTESSQTDQAEEPLNFLPVCWSRKVEHFLFGLVHDFDAKTIQPETGNFTRSMSNLVDA